MKLLVSIILLGALAATVVAQQTTPPAPVTTDSTRPVQVPSPDRTTTKTYAKSTLVVKKALFCKSIKNRRPQGEAAEFQMGIGKLFCWSEIANTGDSTAVVHIWYLGGQKKARVEMPIRHQTGTVWSSKTIPRDWIGTVKVEITTSNGEILDEKSCTVK